MSRKRYDEEFKRKVIQEHEAAGISCYQLGQTYGVDAKCVRSWCRLYKQFGDAYLTANHSNLNYSAEFKLQVVHAYLAGGKIYQSVAAEYEIFAPTTVRQWVMMYNNHEELMDSRPEGSFDMVKDTTRKTTLEERIRIVEHCIANNNDYALSAREFQVSYGQVYSWVKKYISVERKNWLTDVASQNLRRLYRNRNVFRLKTECYELKIKSSRWRLIS